MKTQVRAVILPMRKTVSRLAVLFMAMAMVLTLLPAPAQAAEYADWTNANALPSSGTYRLTTDVTVTGQTAVRSALTLDLNGHKVTLAPSGYSDKAYFVFSGGTLALEDSAGGGLITDSGAQSGGHALIFVNSGGAFSMSGGTVENTAGSQALMLNGGGGSVTGGTLKNSASGGHAAQVNGSSGSLTLSGAGRIENTGDGSLANAVYVNNGSFAQTGGVISDTGSNGALRANVSAQAVEISAGTIESDGVGVYSVDSSVEVKVTGGTIDAGTYAFQTKCATIGAADGTGPSVTAGAAVFSGRHNPDNTILGGAFDAPAVAVLMSGADAGEQESDVLSVSGGSYTASPLAFADPDAAVLGLSSGGGTAYYVGEDVAAGAAAAASGDTIDILQGDVALTGIPGDVTISNSGTGSVTANGEDVPAGGSVTIETFTVVYKTNAGMVMGAVEYMVDDPSNAFPATSEFATHFRAFMLLAAQKGSLYVPSNGEMWFGDAAFTQAAEFPDGKAGESYTVYCKLTVESFYCGGLSNYAEDLSYGDQYFHILGSMGVGSWGLIGRDDAYDGTRAVFEKKTGDGWTEVPESYYLDSEGYEHLTNIFFKGVADSGVYRLKYLRYTATDNAGNELYYVDAYDATGGEYTVNIKPVELTITGVQAEDRACDGTDEVVLTGGALSGVLYNDEVGVELGKGKLADTAVGEDKPVVTNIVLTGEKAANYVLVQPEGLTATITHSAERVPAKAATCTETGNIEYWRCACGMLFADAACATPIDEADVATPLAAHTPEKVARVEPTAAEPGNIEYWRCLACGRLFADEAMTKELTQEQTVLPALGNGGSPNTGDGSPSTGDGSVALWCGLLLLSACGAAALIWKKKLNRA